MGSATRAISDIGGAEKLVSAVLVGHVFNDTISIIADGIKEWKRRSRYEEIDDPRWRV